jgi:hypothetical protein
LDAALGLISKRRRNIKANYPARSLVWLEIKIILLSQSPGGGFIKN